MKKAIAAAAVGLLLVAGQAAAAQNTAAVNVGDRIGVDAGEASEFTSIPMPVLLIGAAVLAATVIVIGEDDGDSD